MLRFFRINDPYRLIFIFLIVLIVRVPFYLTVDWMTVTQLKWAITGESLSFSNHLYIDVLERLSPLSGGVFWLIESISNRSLLLSQALGILITFIQITVINFSFNNRGVFEDKSFTPGLIYGLLSSLYFDFYFLSPVLLSSTFLLLAFNNLLRQIEFKAKRDEKILNTGVYLGLAALFYYPTFIFLFIVLTIYYLFTSTISRRYFLLIFGWLLPIMSTLVFYIIIDGSSDIISVFFTWEAFFSKFFMVDMSILLIIIIIPTLFLLSGLFNALTKSRFNNYQLRIMQAMLVYLTLGSLSLFLVKEVTPNVFLFVLPPLCYFISLSFNSRGKRFLVELKFWVFMVSLLVISYLPLINMEEKSKLEEKYLVNESIAPAEFEDKPILVLRNEYNYFVKSTSATKYQNWDLSRNTWNNSLDPKYLIEIVSEIEDAKPEFIVDSEERHFMKLHQATPIIREHYAISGSYFKRID